MPPFRTQLAVRFADVDHAGIVYYPVFYDYFHIAFEEFFRARLGPRGYVEILDQRKLGFPAVKTQCTYHAPLRFGDEVEIALSVSRIGNSSLTFIYEAAKIAAEGTSSVATGEIICAVVDFTAFRAVPVPADLRRLFLELSREGQVKPA